MAASRRRRPGVLTPSLLAAGLRGEIFALVLRQRLVFGPLLAQVAALPGRDFGELLVGLARLPPLLGRQRCPALHAPLHALLLLGLHRRIALGDADPLEAPLALEAFPVGLERRQRLLLLRGEFGPRRANRRFRLGGGLGGFRRGLAGDLD